MGSIIAYQKVPFRLSLLLLQQNHFCYPQDKMGRDR